VRSVVTGGAGFVGSHLVEHLLAAGDEVVVLDDLSTGSLQNLSHLLGDPRLHVVEGSILDGEVVRATLTGADRVFHLAAAVGVRLIIDEPLKSLRTNIHGTERVLEAAHEVGARVLLVSTSEVYGKNTADALHEDSDRILGSALKSRWTYAAAKGIDEAFAHAYWTQLGLEVAIVRLFNTVGPRQTGRYGMVVPNLVGQALRGDELTVFGDGQQTRCFSSVRDVVPALVAVAEDDRALGRAFNLGGAEEISIGALAERVIAATGSSSGIRLVPYEEAYAGEGFEDMRRRVPDNTAAGELVGFVPRTPLDEMIRAIAADIRSRSGIDGTAADAEASLVAAGTE
jgi:UDP-glucose 4-epimerase